MNTVYVLFLFFLGSSDQKKKWFYSPPSTFFFGKSTSSLEDEETEPIEDSKFETELVEEALDFELSIFVFFFVSCAWTLCNFKSRWRQYTILQSRHYLESLQWKQQMFSLVRFATTTLFIGRVRCSEFWSESN